MNSKPSGNDIPDRIPPTRNQKNKFLNGWYDKWDKPNGQFFSYLVTAALFGDIAWADELKTVPPRENDLANEREGEQLRRPRFFFERKNLPF